jgi:hypothetical protein
MHARRDSDRSTSRLRRLAAALAACALLAVALPAAAGAAQPGVVLPNPTLDDGTLQRIQSSGARHVRVFASWRMLEQQRGQLTPHILAGFDDLADRMKALGIGVYFVVTQTPSWASSSGADNAPPPTGAYADFLRRLAEHFRGRVAAYEIWNEANGNVFWAGGATPAAYTGLLKAGYDAVKAADPAAKVGIGGLVGNDYGYMGKLYEAGAKGSFDFVGVHTDNACARIDPREAARDVDGRISRWSFTGYREIHATMVANGDPKPIWMTELGWQVTNHRCPSNANDPAGVTAANQALFLTRAYSCLASDPYVEMGSWFSIADFGAAESAGGGYGLWSFAGAARPALAAFQRASSLPADPTCGLKVDGAPATIDVAAPTGATGVSGDLSFKATAHDDMGVRTLALLVDGRQIRITSRNRLSGRWTGWRKLKVGQHTVTFKVVDAALHVATKDIVVNKVPYGAGEPVSTRISVGLYGGGRARIAAAQLFTLPREAKRFLRGRLTIGFERFVGSRWRPFGAAAGGSASGGALQRARKFAPGRYRVVVAFGGDRSFARASARRIFTVR